MLPSCIGIMASISPGAAANRLGAACRRYRLATLFRRLSGSPRHEPPYLLHQRLDVVGAVEEGRVTHPVALGEALVEGLARAEGAGRTVPSQGEELHPVPGTGRIRLQVLLDLPA